MLLSSASGGCCRLSAVAAAALAAFLRGFFRFLALLLAVSVSSSSYMLNRTSVSWQSQLKLMKSHAYTRHTFTVGWHADTKEPLWEPSAAAPCDQLLPPPPPLPLPPAHGMRAAPLSQSMASPAVLQSPLQHSGRPVPEL